MAGRKLPRYVVTHHPNQPGEYLLPYSDKDNWDTVLSYEVQSGDLFLCDYPKCGVTWLQNIVWRILHDGEPMTGPLGSNIACLDFDGSEAVEKTRKVEKYHPIKTHLPYKWIPRHPEAKYIFIAREPKDVCVSLYYHLKGFLCYEWQDGSFDDLASGFLEGKVDTGDYFDIVSEWYLHRNDPSTLFLLYEDLSTDTKATILTIAKFLGQEYVELLEKNDQRMLGNIIQETTLNKMRKQDQHWAREDRTPGRSFVRKGIIGDWRNHLTSEQAEAINQKLKKAAAGSGCEKLWAKWNNGSV